jgi:hypothetical protein
MFPACKSLCGAMWLNERSLGLQRVVVFVDRWRWTKGGVVLGGKYNGGPGAGGLARIAVGCGGIVRRDLMHV